MPGLLDFLGSDASPSQQGLLALATGLLQGSGPSRVPVGFGQILGNALPGAQQAYRGGVDRQAIQKALQAQNPQDMMASLGQVSDPALQKEILANRLTAMTPKYEATKDAFGNPIAFNSLNPSQSVPIGGGQGAFGGMQLPGGQPGAQPGMQAQGAPGGQPQGASGDAFLQTLPPQIATQVKALAEGRMQFPGGFALKSPYWQQMVSAVSQYDPSFDAVNYNARSGTRKSFTSGPDANNITALNTAMSHASSLQDAYGNLGNTDYPWLNTAKNWLGNEFGNDATQTNTAAVGTRGHALSEELAKVFRSTGMAESDIKAWENKLSTSATPAQSKEVLNSGMDLMEGRLQALSSKYNQGMGTTKSGIDLLSPEAQKAYAKVRGMAPGAATAGGGASTPQQGAAPKPTLPPASAIAFLKANPDQAAAFEAKYGIPAASVLGGGASGSY